MQWSLHLLASQESGPGFGIIHPGTQDLRPQKMHRSHLGRVLSKV